MQEPRKPKMKPFSAKKHSFTIPKLPLYYRAKKMHYLVVNYEKALQHNPSSVDLSKYLKLLSEFQDVNEQLIKRGLHTREGRSKARMDNGTVARIGQQEATSAVGDGESPKLGDGVSTSNPLA